MTHFTTEQADARAVELTGLTAPTITLYHSYKEDWSYTMPDNFLNTTWACTHSKVLRGESLLSFRSQEGNLVKGVLLVTNPCDSASEEVVGRYNDQYLYLYSAEPSQRTSLRRYRITNGGRILIKEASLYLEGEPEESPQNGSTDDEGEKYSSTNFLATTDRSILSADEINQPTASGDESGSGLADKVKELKTLFDQGLLSEDEYKAQRDQLIRDSLDK